MALPIAIIQGRTRRMGDASLGIEKLPSCGPRGPLQADEKQTLDLLTDDIRKRCLADGVSARWLAEVSGVRLSACLAWLVSLGCYKSGAGSVTRYRLWSPERLAKMQHWVSK